MSNHGAYCSALSQRERERERESPEQGVQRAFAFSERYLFPVKTMDKAVIAETYIIGCFASFQTEKDGIVQLPSVGTFESFCDALTVWINKPHVANRRLIGSKILYQNNTCTTESRVDSFIKKCLSSAESAEVIHGFVEEVPPLSSFVDANFYFIIRENFYKGSRQTSLKETIVIGI